MKITHTVNIEGNEHLPLCFEGETELKVEVFVRVASWEKDDMGRPVIEDLEIEQIDLHPADGKLIIAQGELEQAILDALDNDHDFMSKVYAESYEEGEDALRERAIERAESARECRRGN